MVSKTNEAALEALIESHLADVGAFQIGQPTDFDAQFAVDTRFLWQFLETTQAEELDKLKRNSAVDWQRKILERFDRLIKKHGILHLLKKGLSVDDAFFNLMYPAPLASSSKSVVDNFAANIFSVTRQVRYSLANPGQEIDMVLFINGIALVSLELKNAWTGQSARYHGTKQYREDRDTSQPLLQFGRCLVHMAVDTDEVYMTTKLAGKATFFLPFNKGHNHGQGNPPNMNGHKTAYLWEEVFTRESLANIIQHFVRLDGSAKDPLAKRTLFFPRYHQLDVVRRLIDHAATHGAGQTYLIQHSAGSGKSNSITWAAFQLIETYMQGQDKPLFDSVIVVTDRRLLDKQLRENIKEFSEVKNIIAPVQSSRELKTALEDGKKIIITTIQKFPFIIEGISDLSDKKFAVIIDEAHSSQSGTAHDNMNRAMGKDDSDAVDAQDKIIEAMQSRKMRGNASYLAFTATPKNTTLEKFGQQQPDGSFEPFHLYSMKQAIEEGFILDVLANYTTYKSYYEIEKSITENPEFDTKKAQKKLRAYVESSQQTINTKAEIMLEHFIPSVVNAKKLRGKAKGMVVTQNIETAIRYYKAVTRLLEAQGNPFKALIAFSGDKNVDGIDYSEAGMNGFPETKTRDKFDTDEYRLLIVANKYLTGFDQPKLAAMYVDKKLQGVMAVQALSRLNRSAPKLGKKTEDLFILDFFNSVDDIKNAFDPFYTATSLSEATDVNVLHELKDVLDDVGVYDVLQTERLILYGEEVAGKDRKEALMILNHKEAIQYLVDNLDEISLIRPDIFSIHALLSDGLLADPAMSGRLRVLPVGISHSSYKPLDDAVTIDEEFDIILHKASEITDPFEQSFFLLVHIPYLQAFVDINKRTSRVASNIPLLKADLAPMSFLAMDDGDYIDGLIGIYELNNVSLLREVYIESYLASAEKYRVLRAEVETPEKAAIVYRNFVREAVRHCVLVTKSFQPDAIKALAKKEGIPEGDLEDVVAYVGQQFRSLHEGNAIRYRLKPKDLEGIL